MQSFHKYFKKVIIATTSQCQKKSFSREIQWRKMSRENQTICHKKREFFDQLLLSCSFLLEKKENFSIMALSPSGLPERNDVFTQKKKEEEEEEEEEEE